MSHHLCWLLYSSLSWPGVQWTWTGGLWRRESILCLAVEDAVIVSKVIFVPGGVFEFASSFGSSPRGTSRASLYNIPYQRDVLGYHIQRVLRLLLVTSKQDFLPQCFFFRWFFPQNNNSALWSKAEEEEQETSQQKMHQVSLEVIMLVFLSVHSTVLHTNRQKNER